MGGLLIVVEWLNGTKVPIIGGFLSIPNLAPGNKSGALASSQCTI